MFTEIARPCDTYLSHEQFVKNNEHELGRFNNFFEMPWGRSLWLDADPNYVAKFFFDTLLEINSSLESERESAIKEFRSQSLFRKLTQLICGWRTPQVPSVLELIEELCRRCLELMRWIRLRIILNLYVHDDLSTFLRKVREVLLLLNSSPLPTRC